MDVCYVHTAGWATHSMSYVEASVYVLDNLRQYSCNVGVAFVPICSSLTDHFRNLFLTAADDGCIKVYFSFIKSNYVSCVY